MALDWIGIRGALLASLGASCAASIACRWDRPTCDEPKALKQPSGSRNVPTGWLRCEDGTTHRRDAEACILDDIVGSCSNAGSASGSCAVDSDCGVGELCNAEVGTTECSCHLPCSTDGDCAEGEICFCDGAATRCISAWCRTDADCGADYFCGLSGELLACHGPDDECQLNSDCGDDCSDCVYDEIWFCTQPACSAGRPFLVGGALRVAPLVRSGEWCGTPVADCEISEHDARRLADHWTAVGVAEHASVAAFARFALELLAVAAPPELATECARAMADEIEHARLAFALATRYAGHAVGPGPLALDGVLAQPIELVAVACSVAREACVGETLAAIEAAEAEQHATDPDATAALRRIAADELRHAALGWRFLAWALACTEAHERARILAELDLAIAGAATLDSPNGEGSVEQLRHGRLDEVRRAASTRRGVIEVLAPLRAAVHAVTSHGHRALS